METLKKDIHDIAERFNDLFPMGQLTLGGSVALKLRMPEWHIRTDDIDLYLNVSIARRAFRKVLETMIFPDEDIMFEEKEYDAMPEHGNYRMDDIVKKITVQRYNRPNVDFIFTKSRYRVTEWLLMNQASTLTEVCYRLDHWGRSDQMRKPLCTDAFNRVADKGKPVQIRVDDKYCSREHMIKVVTRCHDLGLEIEKV